MPFDSDKHHRRSTRLRDYDYTQEGAYVITICTYQRQCLFGDVIDCEVMLNTLGCIVVEEWERTALIRPYVTLEDYIVMPNHFHAIILLSGASVGACRRQAPTDQQAPTHKSSTPQFSNPIAKSLGTIILQFKGLTTRRVNKVRGIDNGSIWQRNYHDHIIRDDKSLNRIREYIQLNPERWSADQENPINFPS